MKEWERLADWEVEQHRILVSADPKGSYWAVITFQSYWKLSIDGLVIIPTPIEQSLDESCLGGKGLISGKCFL